MTCDSFLNQLRVLCSQQQKNPKGFDKYFDKQPKQQSSSDPETSADKSSSNESSKTNPSKSASSQDPTKPPPNDWSSFGMFGPNPPAPNQGRQGSQGQGRPIGGPENNPDTSRMIMFGVLGAVAVFSALLFFDMQYKEISWKEFVNK